MTEDDLLTLASQIAYRKQKYTQDSKDILEKYKCRLLHVCTCYDLFESSEEVDEYYQEFHKQFIDKYNG